MDIEIIDAHHHLWDLAANYYPWLTDRVTKRVCGEYSAIRKDYLIDDYFNDASQVNLVKSIHVQAVCEDPIAETKWLTKVAEDPKSNGFPQGIVAYADFSKDNIQEVLEKHVAYDRVVGIRQMLHEAKSGGSSEEPSLLENPVWWKNFFLMDQFDLSFDLQIYYQQFPLAESLLKKHPNVQFVLCHTGQPERRDPKGIEGWKKGMQRLAQYENLVVKLSGFGMFDRNWTSDSIRPFLLHTIDTFGTERCLFGSNFPVDGMMTDYTRLWTSYQELTSDYSDHEQQQLFSQNAEKIYLQKLKTKRA